MIAALLAAVLSATPAPAPCDVQPTRPGQEGFITRAAFADGRLWMVNDAGALFSIAEREPRLRRERLPAKALDLCVRDGHVAVLTCGDAGAWPLRRRDGRGRWPVETRFPARNDVFLALSCGPSLEAVITQDRLVVHQDGTLRETPLSSRLFPGLVAATLTTPDEIFVGMNAGEWGGGLRRIDVRTGNVTSIDQIDSDVGACGGLLNPECDPVHAMVTEPWNRRCIIAAIGLVHFASSGRLVEICGTTVRRVLELPSASGLFRSSETKSNGELYPAVAFFGVVVSGDAVLAAGIDGLYRVTADGSEKTTLPEFHDVGGVHVSFAVPDAALILTGVNARKSLSGAVPMLVPR